MKLLVAELALLSMLGLPLAIARAEPRVAAQLDMPALMKFACSVMEYDCKDIALPKIDFEPIYAQGYLGLFSPATEDTIYVDSQIVPYFDVTYVQSVVVHELTHYIDWQLHPAEMLASPCWAENNGWRVSNAWLTVHGRDDITDFSWNLRYGCFQ